MFFELDKEEYKEYSEEAVEKLRKYIQINTCERNGNVESGMSFLTSILDEEGIEYTILMSPNKKKSILAKIKGKNEEKKSLVLLNHIDVVPANIEEWDFNPYGGEVINDYITGRGAIDMKSMCIIQLISLVYLTRKKIVPERTIYFLAVPDEELGGIEGTKFVVKNYLKVINPQIVLDEGGWGSQKHYNNPVFFVAYGQKRGVFLKIVAHGKAGHGAQPHVENANNRLIKALNKIRRSRYPISDDKEIWGNIKDIMYERNKIDYFLALNYKIPGFKVLLEKRYRNDKFISSLFRDTITTTVIKSGNENNVIPKVASAVLDCRIMPNKTVEELIDWLKKIIQDTNVEVSILKELKEAKKTEGDIEFVNVLKKVLGANYKNARVIPYLTPLGTDVKYFREHNVSGLGLFPGILEEEDLNTMHGINEKISLKTYKKACKAMMEIVYNYCIKKELS